MLSRCDSDSFFFSLYLQQTILNFYARHFLNRTNNTINARTGINDFSLRFTFAWNEQQVFTDS